MAKSKVDRIVMALFGAFFLVLAGLVLFAAWDSTPFGAIAVASVLGLLGVDAMLSAKQDRPSILSRIGPLP